MKSIKKPIIIAFLILALLASICLPLVHAEALEPEQEPEKAQIGKNETRDADDKQENVPFFNMEAEDEDLFSLVELGDTEFPLSIADVAEEEVFALDSCEMPIGSDDVKYNRWFYGEHVSNPLENGEYEQNYRWNTVFVVWCANKVGLIDFGGFPKTANSKELLNLLLKAGNTVLTKEELSSEDTLAVERSDLVFLPNDAGYTVGIITEVQQSGFVFILGDVQYGVGKLYRDITNLPDGALVMHLNTSENAELYAFTAYLCDKLVISPAAACGILANIKRESEFDPKATGDEGTAFGICQWRFSRWDMLVNFCDANGYSWRRLKGQMEFLVHDLKDEFPYLLDMIRKCDNTDEGAYQAAFYFCDEYERPYGKIISADQSGWMAAHSLFPLLLLHAEVENTEK